MKKKLNEYQKFVVELYAACSIEDDNIVLIDSNKVSYLLEKEFLKIGLLKDKD